MVTIAVTGGVACGKSLLGEWLIARGIPVCDADDLAHEEIRAGTGCYQRIVESFGNGILADDGEIDRAALGKIVFYDPAERERLNAIIHPEVRRRWIQWRSQQEANDAESKERSVQPRMAAIIIPLLYETGETEGWYRIVCVSSSRELQMTRLMARGLTEEDARLRIAAQMPLATKEDMADFVLINNGTRQLLRDQAARALSHMVGS